MDLQTPENNPNKNIIRIATIIVAVILLFVISCGIFIKYYEGKVYPGVKVNNFDLGGLNYEQTEKVVLGEFIQTFKKGLKLKYKDTEKQIPLQFENKDTITPENSAMTKDLLQFGRSHNIFSNFYQITKALTVGVDFPMQTKVNEYLLEQHIKNEFSAFESPSQNSQIELTIENADKKIYKTNFTEEKSGQGFNYQETIEQIKDNLETFNNKTITLTLEEQSPQITKTMAENKLPDFEKYYSEFDDFTLQYADDKLILDWQTIMPMLNIAINNDDELNIIVSKQLIYGHLESFGQTIDREPQDAKFQIKNNRVTEFQASLNGQKLDIEKTYNKINKEFITNKNNIVEAIVTETEPNITTSSVNDLGIVELVAVGKSNFSGSPANRRHNIGVGAAAINGALIAPGEEFKLVPLLGSIDASNGYLPELVIKGNETIPEYGGGLCQIGTTTFRLAVNAGLPITERRNHSYRVSYYEPAGTDATIYSPRPDVRFINDYNKHLLLQTRISGNELIFEFWGTTDGREIKVDDPVIYNIVSPGPTKEIESEELAPGQRKCIESAHAGADAYFDRLITYANGETKEDRWTSHYVPWQAVCLIGVDPDAKEAEAQEILEQQKEEETATSQQSEPTNIKPEPTE